MIAFLFVNVQAGDTPLHDGHDEASRANYFDPDWAGFKKQ